MAANRYYRIRHMLRNPVSDPTDITLITRFHRTTKLLAEVKRIFPNALGYQVDRSNATEFNTFKKEWEREFKHPGIQTLSGQ